MSKGTILITGAGRGLGAGLAVYLGRRGYGVGVHYYRSQGGAQRVVEEIRAGGGCAEAFGADLSRQGDAEDVVRRVVERFGGLLGLINNAGVYEGKGLYELTEEEWRRGLESTVTATFYATRAAMPYLRQAGRGRVVNIGDSGCDRATARDLAMSYHVGKVGVYMVTRSFARAEAGNGVTVNMVSPGWLENSVGLPPVGVIPAGRYGTFEDVAGVVEFLLEERSGYLTGSNLIVSGGWNLR